MLYEGRVIIPKWTSLIHSNKQRPCHIRMLHFCASFVPAAEYAKRIHAASQNWHSSNLYLMIIFWQSSSFVELVKMKRTALTTLQVKQKFDSSQQPGFEKSIFVDNAPSYIMSVSGLQLLKPSSSSGSLRLQEERVQRRSSWSIVLSIISSASIVIQWWWSGSHFSPARAWWMFLALM